MSKYGAITGKNAVQFKRLLPGPIERVWEHLVDGEKRGRWFCSGETGTKVGGSLEMIFRNNTLSDAPDVPPPEKHKDMPEEIRMSGTITAFEPHTLFSHTWVFGEEYSEVSYELQEQGDKVLLTLTHTHVDSREMKVDVCGGWHAHLDVLDDILNNKKPGPFWKRIGELAIDYEKRVPADA